MYFQLRLKDYPASKILNIGKKIRKITKKYKVKFLINDFFSLVPKIKADGCHMGQLDGSFKIARSKLKNKILGITCHNSKILAKNAKQNKADYIAFGPTFKSKTKEKETISLSQFKKFKNKIKLPYVFIGGINQSNIKKLVSFKPNNVAIINSLWNFKQGPVQSALKFKENLEAS